ncbi:hypothetical protein NQ315_002057 [Exocentrus adspersus]|uniref:Cation efflux protein transmembrane domain-containing protein n=1 Tax=Exocentrus adspersus TaxID=1586481 RepID=A0AAV8VGI8_9CUCU|nr:hypothetical protein NQ315_002057 [Exocentrus adspersus]
MAKKPSAPLTILISTQKYRGDTMNVILGHSRLSSLYYLTFTKLANLKKLGIADSYHPYGYSNMKYVASLISGVGIFCVGTGLSFYHGISGLMHPTPMDDFFGYENAH